MNLVPLSAAIIAASSMSPLFAVAHADTIPVTRSSTVSASWYERGGFQPTGGSASDGTTTFDPFSRTVSAGGGTATQTSSFTPTTVYASVSATGWANSSVMNAAGASGTSTFTYTFELTAPATLSFTGDLWFGDFMSYSFGFVRLYNDASGAMVYNARNGQFTFGALHNTFDEVYYAPAGRYRFVVSAYNGGAGPAGAHTCGATVTMTLPVSIPTPSAIALLPFAAGALSRRGRR